MSFLLIDGQGITLFGLHSIIRKEFPNCTCDAVHDVNKAMKLFERNVYSLIVLELNITGISMQRIIEWILVKNPSQKIMIYTNSPEAIYAHRLLRLGVKGFVNKDQPLNEFIVAVQAILNKGLYMSCRLLEKISQDYLTDVPSNPFDRLSPREMEVFHFMIKGYKLSEIANIMHLHRSTIGTHRARLLNKLQLRKLFDLRDLAVSYGIPLHD